MSEALLEEMYGVERATLAVYQAKTQNPIPAFGTNQYAVTAAAQAQEWYEKHSKAIDKVARFEKLKVKWAEEADILAHPDSRAALYALVRGEKSRTKITEFTKSQKLIKSAKAKLAAREQRRADRRVVEDVWKARPGRLLVELRQQWHLRAVKMGYAYHDDVKPLFKSKYATIDYGRGGLEEKSFPYKGSYKSWAARWKNAGARLDNEDHPKFVILENYLGNEVARLPFRGLTKP